MVNMFIYQPPMQNFYVFFFISILSLYRILEASNVITVWCELQCVVFSGGNMWGSIRGEQERSDEIVPDPFNTPHKGLCEGIQFNQVLNI